MYIYDCRVDNQFLVFTIHTTVTSISRKIDLHQNLREAHCKLLHEELGLQFDGPTHIKRKLLPSRAQELTNSPPSF